MKVLVVDDDELIRAVVQESLGKRGYDVICVADAETAASRLQTFEPDLVVLDIMLPGQSGIEFCQELRRSRAVPVIFLSGLNSEVDRIVGLEIGGDDYLTKPFHPGELLARVKAVLRRASPSGSHAVVKAAPASPVLEHGTLQLDTERFVASIEGTHVDLTKTEFGLLRTLLRTPTKVYSRDELVAGAYGPGVYVAEKTVNSHMRRLRLKLEEAGLDPIETVRSVGYRLIPTLVESPPAPAE